MGVNVERMRVITFGLGSSLVGAAGCLFIPIYYIYPDIGGQFTLISFVITILGGLGSTVGAIIGGLILGCSSRSRRPISAWAGRPSAGSSSSSPRSSSSPAA